MKPSLRPMGRAAAVAEESDLAAEGAAAVAMIIRVTHASLANRDGNAHAISWKGSGLCAAG
jgi:hypothetical protein